MAAPETSASAWVRRFAGLVPAGAPVLDLACGGGRHTHLFASAGHPVTAVDRDASRVRSLAGEFGRGAIEVIEADLEAGLDAGLEVAPFHPAGVLGGRTFGGIVVTNYLHRPLLEPLVATLQPGGVLIYETFALGNAELGGRVRNPAFLLAPGELLALAAGRLRVIAYEDTVEPGSPPAAIQRICAVRRETLA